MYPWILRVARNLQREKKRQLQRIRSAGYHHGILRPYLSIVPNRAYGFLPRELIRARPPRLSKIGRAHV